MTVGNENHLLCQLVTNCPLVLNPEMSFTISGTDHPACGFQLHITPGIWNFLKVISSLQISQRVASLVTASKTKSTLMGFLRSGNLVRTPPHLREGIRAPSEQMDGLIFLPEAVENEFPSKQISPVTWRHFLSSSTETKVSPILRFLLTELGFLSPPRHSQGGQHSRQAAHT